MKLNLSIAASVRQLFLSGTFGKKSKLILLCVLALNFCFGQSGMNYGDPISPAGSYQSFNRLATAVPNPDIPDSLLCQDLRVIFILDESGSIAGSGATQAVRDGVRSLANALYNSGATLQLIEFNQTSRVVDLGLTLVNSTFISRLESYLTTGYNSQDYDPGGSTNWQSALIDAEPIPADLIIFFTDGYPNTYNTSGGGTASGLQEALDLAVAQANILKTQGKHMFGVGVGPGIDLPNIQAISDADPFGGAITVLTADYTTPPYDQLAINLAAVVNTICGTELAIEKTASAEGVCAGETVTFTSTITNTGGSFSFDANNVVMTDVYPNGYSNLEILAPATGASISGNTVTYPVGNLSPGQSATLVVRAVVDAPPGNYNNVVTGTAYNANPVKDSASVISGYSTGDVYVSACTRVTVNGQTYTAAGDYTQTLVSAAGCDSLLTIHVSLKTAASYPIRCSGAGISCTGYCNGRARVSVYGDPANYSILWNTTPPKSTAEITGLCPGTYKVNTIDNEGCPDSCSVTIPNEPCGDFRTYTQGGYGAIPKGKNVASYLKSKFATVFPAGLTIGCNNKLKLTTWQAVVDFLPSGSTPAALPAGTLINPGQAYQNVLAGQLVAATLNVKFDSASASFSPSSLLLKDLIIASGIFSGWTVSQLLEEANRAIGGCGSIYTFSSLNEALDKVNNNYNYNEYTNSPLNNRCYLSCPIAGQTLSTVRQYGRSTNSENDVVLEDELYIYPNPANDNLSVKYIGAREMKLKIDLLSATGNNLKEIYNSGIRKGEKIERSIPVYQLTPGIYWIRVKSGNNGETKMEKLIIAR